MQMYKWRSFTLRNFSYGLIIVQAPSVSKARRKALAHFDEVLKLHWDWGDSEYLAEQRESFINDLADEPEEIEILCLFGSQ